MYFFFKRKLEKKNTLQIPIFPVCLVEISIGELREDWVLGW